MYSWGGYSAELLDYYKNPGEGAKFAERLEKDIENAEKKDRVPPGLYAEYGYMMLELGEVNTAVIFFTKEKDKWPESAHLMDTVIGQLAKVVPARARVPEDAGDLPEEATQ